MSKDLSYRDYVNDGPYMDTYSKYQERYAREIRESDKVLIQFVREHAEDGLKQGQHLTLLDIGCSTGNLLFHIKRAVPGIELFGGDIVSSIIADCRNNPDLASIRFAEMDMLNLARDEQFDIIVSNASLMFFNDDEFDRAIVNIGRATRSGGWFIAFDYFHPYEQAVAIIENSQAHPQGLKFHFRGYSRGKVALEKAQFGNPEFQPFHIPIDLPKAVDPANINTHTVRTHSGERLSFRGALSQPWCFLLAQKR